MDARSDPPYGLIHPGQDHTISPQAFFTKRIECRTCAFRARIKILQQLLFIVINDTIGVDRNIQQLYIIPVDYPIGQNLLALRARTIAGWSLNLAPVFPGLFSDT
uniref:Uncharacterized protein n=1 Tax=Candidatus Kentrum sp. LPFa TaxID=2126335 RepID=A0A450WGS2_9GAMM|nr:MAG: hypothetical protein BECKLPF1236B_GA0070989_10922 [Candidatus Kentron sp. LPFa]